MNIKDSIDQELDILKEARELIRISERENDPITLSEALEIVKNQRLVKIGNDLYMEI